MRTKIPAALAAAKQQGFYSIGKAAVATGVTAKMIRHYETLGLIQRAERTVGHYRLYSARDLHALRFIRRARDLGFPIKDIAGLLGLWRDQRRSSAAVKRLAQQHAAELDRKIQELQAMRAALAGLAARCHGDTRPECPILDDLEALPSAR
jgi:Cu(I)-responsive transcriptional regulator